jgi:hypothetical protein
MDAGGRPCKAADAVEFAIPEDAGKRVWLVGDHLTSFQAEAEVLLWFTEWSVWPSGERLHLFYRLRASYGDTRLLIDAPAHLFDHDEFDDLVSFATVGVLFLWDAFIVSGRGPQMLHYSHEEFGWRSVHNGRAPQCAS